MQNWLQSGNWNALCDSCGRKFKASELLKRWDGLMVCKEDWEPRHPQDLLRVQRERINVPWSRPYNVPDIFVNTCTISTSSGFADLSVADCAHADQSNPTYTYLLNLDTPNPPGTFYQCTLSGSSGYAGLGTAGCWTIENSRFTYAELVYASTPADS